MSLFSEFEQKMEEVFSKDAFPEKIAIAVSGGSDSLALCLLANEWCKKNTISLLAITVDHGLRPEAALEAKSVKKWLAEIGVEHRTLNWEGPYPATGIQQAARSARYELMFDECDQHSIDTLLLGHQLEDQLETILMRLSRGSGLEGLAAMGLVTYRRDKKLVRPLLDMPRGSLRHYLEQHGQSWFDDPSNDNLKYTRTKLGPILKSLTALPGSDLQTVALASKRLQRADDALDNITKEYLVSHASISPLGIVTFPVTFFEMMPTEIAIRFVDRIFTFVRGRDEKPSLTAVENLLAEMAVHNGLSAKTLAGCQLIRSKARWIICREAGRHGFPTLVFNQLNIMCWDDRFTVVDRQGGHAESDTQELEVRVIGEEGWRILKNLQQPEMDIDLPSSVLKNLPGIWKNDKLIAAPLFSYENERLGIAQRRFEMVFSPKYSLIE